MQIISISSLKGGVGKTSVTLGLASAARAARIPTLVVDMDPHADASTGLGVQQDAVTVDLGTMLAKPRRYQLADHVLPAGWSENESPHAPDTATASTHQPILDVVRGSSRTSIFERPTTRTRELRRLSQLLSSVTRYGLVLIDCPPALNGVTRMAWAASTDVLLVAEPSLFSVAGTERSMRALDLFRREYAPAVQSTGVVVNRVRMASKEHKFRLAEMSRMFGDRLLPVSIPETSNWQQIQGAAWSVHAWPGETASRTSKLFDEMLTSVMRPSKNRRERRPSV
ncbi:ParA family protein [Citricoccus muralis]|uniref:ParA family protein n=1 Tax=Citricoccus muralis TaxID=169134 RepID=A0ABY8H4B2_9MICC|nr:ParA family protein [Citricoccus muralis]WFP15528.1 ParA family protein [Citricoccus muralis]